VEKNMTNEQVDQLIALLGRYVYVEEQKLQLTIQQLRVRNAVEERSVKALEKQADGLKVSGSLTATRQSDEK
jgi:hypothetical protein